MNLKDKKILITGATGGIGHSLVKKFYELGSVILATGTNEVKLAQLQKEFKNIKTKSFKLGVTVGYEYIIAIILVLKLLMMH